MQEIERRLFELERSQRFLKRLVIGSIAALSVALLTAGAYRHHGKTIEAERFVIRGSDGYYRGELGVSPEGVPVLVLTAKPDTTVAARLPESMGGVYLFDSRGDQQAAFQLGHRGGAEVLVGDSVLTAISSGRFMVYKNGEQTWTSPK